MSKKNKQFLDNYNKYLDKIFNYIWYRVGFDRTISEDLCSEIFIKAYKNYNNFDETKPFQSWIYAIAKNHLLNYYRTMGREVSLENAINLSIDSLSKININLEVESVLGHINNLDEYSKEIIILRYVEQLDTKEIADFLGKEPNAIRVQLSRALEKLRKKID